METFYDRMLTGVGLYKRCTMRVEGAADIEAQDHRSCLEVEHVA